MTETGQVQTQIAGPGPVVAPPGVAPAVAHRRQSWRALLTDPVPWLALAAVFAADQVTKAVVRSNLRPLESWPDTGFFRFTHAWNTGTAFGLFQDYGNILTVVSLFAMVILFVFYRSAGSPSLLLRLAFGMQLGGAFGNLLDRLRMGYVTDFIDVGPWPIFNIADSSIVVGISFMAYYFWRGTGVKEPAGQGAVASQTGAATVAEAVAPADPSVQGTSGRPRGQ
jgi:signal peptidase II